ncbi:MAG: hypothetical protein IPL19_27360 [Sandaracinaceae bacterium]|nr:hypothetical protein [Sandaracinaceae bacterium]MBK8411676.1 hypothetical protein [Sandaracinaceae bacterium]MBP7685029.1 hypothetical protein [Deltaproteobacteria bacterium]
MVGFSYKTVLVGCACAAAFMGCGGGSSGPDGLGDDILAAECDFLFRCAGDEDDAYDRLYYGTEGACFEAEQGSFDLASEFRPYLDAGTVAFDSAAARRCLAELRRTCSETAALQQACDSIFVGQVPDGGGCSSDIECVSGSCSGNAISCGSCQALIATGSPCDSFSDTCADGPNGEFGYCDFGGTCAIDTETFPTADAALGTPCDGDEQGCEPGLFCQDDICARWRTVDESCDPYSDSCAPGSFCRPTDADEDVGICVRVRMENGPGEDCGLFATEAVVCDARAGLYCTGEDEPGVCALYQPSQTQGEFCDSTAECVEGLECRSGQCFGDLLVDGSVCAGDGQCESGNCVQDLSPPFARMCQGALTCP